MTSQDVKPFAAHLTLTAELYGAVLSEARIAAYFDALQDLNWPEVEAGLRVARQRCKFFPTPAELRGLLEEDTEAEAAAGFALVMQNCGEHVSDEARRAWNANPLLRAVVQRMGGLGVFKYKQFGGSAWRVFLKLYVAEANDRDVRRALEAPALKALPGTFR